MSSPALISELILFGGKLGLVSLVLGLWCDVWTWRDVDSLFDVRDELGESELREVFLCPLSVRFNSRGLF